MITLLKFWSEIYEDDYNEGEGKATGCGYPVTAIAEQFEDTDKAFKWFSDHYGYNMSDYETDEDNRVIYTSRMVADHCEAQNGGWMEPTEAETTAWKQGKQKLYVENVFITLG